ncbi:MAG: hypothetical protein ONB16_00980 [candidate division KSB1 bacterium]|nr:hypothetical protein [candidate division KSB1 bacterium]MDZ7317920.1 hypothetical protein [candidate division KSB1 bacterium]MDZ7340691.1 hypothetical protein [candidate division KSB1 bacterium]
MKKKYSLYDEMKEFNKQKKLYAVILLVIGMFGLIFPIIPGLLFIGLAIALFSPQLATALMAKLRSWFKSLRLEF